MKAYAKPKTLALIFACVLTFVGATAVTSSQANSPKRKIVVFEKNFVNDKAKDKLIENTGGVQIKNLNLINAKAVYLPSKAAEKALSKQSGVLRIDDDVEVHALAKVRKPKPTSPTPTPPSQTLPWGIQQVNAPLVWNNYTGTNVKVAVLDTGISLNHPDLAANIKGGYNAINPRKSANDDNGHGSHVAGTIAGINNEIGIIGGAYEADLYAIKSLDRNGSGYLSDIIEGLDWAIANNMQVINMSLGTDSDIASFHEAITIVYEAGIVQIAASGNDGGAVDFPGAYPEVIAVSALDSNNQITLWSSRGPEVDLGAPGLDIYSTWKGDGYNTISGTSMATPHVTATAVLIISQNNNLTPDEVKNLLTSSAFDLGTPGYDNLYGYGLVDAYNALY